MSVVINVYDYEGVPFDKDQVTFLKQHGVVLINGVGLPERVPAVDKLLQELNDLAASMDWVLRNRAKKSLEDVTRRMDLELHALFSLKDELINTIQNELEDN